MFRIGEKELKNQLMRFLPKKSKRFLAVNFTPVTAEILWVEGLPEGVALLAYKITKIQAPEEEKKEAIAPQDAEFAPSRAGLVAFLQGFIDENSIEEKDIILSISDSDSVVVKDLVLPVLPQEEMREAVKLQLQEEAAFDLNDDAVDWQVVGDYTDEDGTKKNRVISIGIRKEIIDRYISAAQECKLSPLSIINNSFNYTGLLKYVPQDSPVSAILDIGAKGATLNIYGDNKLLLVRKLPISLEKLTRSLRGVLVTEKGKVALSREEAGEILNTFGIPDEETQLNKDNIQVSSILSLMRPLLEALVRDLRLSLNYFTSSFAMSRPSSLYITGEGANLKNLDKYLNKEFDIKVSYLPLPECVKNHVPGDEALSQEAQNKLSSVVGAALGGLKTINLLPFEIKMQRIEFIEKAFLRLVAITMGLIFLFLLFAARFQIHDYENRVKSLQQHLQTIEGIRGLGQKVHAKEALVKKIREGKIPAEGLLKAISALIPGEVILDELILDQGSHSLTLKGAASVAGNAPKSGVFDFIKQLEASSFFQEVDLVSSSEEGAIQKFSLRCELVH